MNYLLYIDTYTYTSPFRFLLTLSHSLLLPLSVLNSRNCEFFLSFFNQTKNYWYLKKNSILGKKVGQVSVTFRKFPALTIVQAVVKGIVILLKRRGNFGGTIKLTSTTGIPSLYHDISAGGLEEAASHVREATVPARRCSGSLVMCTWSGGTENWRKLKKCKIRVHYE